MNIKTKPASEKPIMYPYPQYRSIKDNIIAGINVVKIIDKNASTSTLRGEFKIKIMLNHDIKNPITLHINVL